MQRENLFLINSLKFSSLIGLSAAFQTASKKKKKSRKKQVFKPYWNRVYCHFGSCHDRLHHASPWAVSRNRDYLMCSNFIGKKCVFEPFRERVYVLACVRTCVLACFARVRMYVYVSLTVVHVVTAPPMTVVRPNGTFSLSFSAPYRIQRILTLMLGRAFLWLRFKVRARRKYALCYPDASVSSPFLILANESLPERLRGSFRQYFGAAINVARVALCCNKPLEGARSLHNAMNRNNGREKVREISAIESKTAIACTDADIFITD